MKLAAAFLADDATPNPDGTFNVWRAGIGRTAAPSFPVYVKYALVVMLEAEPDEVIGKMHELRIHASHAGGSIGTLRVPVAAEEIPGQKWYLLRVLVTVDFVANTAGEGTFEMSVDGELLPLIHFEVVPADTVGPAASS